MGGNSLLFKIIVSVHLFFPDFLVGSLPLDLVACCAEFMMFKSADLPLLASEYFNSTEVSTMYFLICWGHYISKNCTIAIHGGSLVVKISF